MATAVNVEIKRKQNENNGSVLKRFTKKVQESSVLSKVRSIRYAQRELSKYNVKKKKLRSVAKKAEIEKMIKLGKMPEKPFRRKR